MSAERVQRAQAIATAAGDKQAKRLVALDVREVCSFADSFILASGGSDRHVRSIADGVLEAAARTGEKALGVEGYEEGRWILIDLNDVIVHVFVEEAREYYDLDRLWSDARPLPLAGEADARAVR